MNVVTKSGTNQFHGSLFGYWSPRGPRASWKELQTPNGTINTTETNTSDFGVAAGGPLVRDKLFFFGAFNPQYQNRSFIAPDDVENFPLRSLGAQERKRRIYSYAGKLTWQASSNHRFDLSVFGDPSNGENGPQRFTSLRAQDTDAVQRARRPTAATTRRCATTASSPRTGSSRPRSPTPRSSSRSSPRSTSGTSPTSPSCRTSAPAASASTSQKTDGKNWQYALKSTNIVNAAGTHQFRYGVQYEDIEYQRVSNRTGPTFTLSNGQQTRTGASGVTIRNAPELGPGAEFYRVVPRQLRAEPPLTTQKYLNWFAQDTWQINNNLTIKAGVRWEKQTLERRRRPLCCFDESQQRAGDGEPGNGNDDRLRVHLEQQLGPAPRRDLRHHRQRQDQAVRQLRPLLREGPERPRRPRAVRRRRRDPRRLLRRRPDPADPRRRRWWAA